MTPHSIDIAIRTPVRLRTMTTAIVMAQRLAETMTSKQLLHISRGSPAVADALALRLQLLANLLETDPPLREIVRRLTAREIAAVLSVVRLRRLGEGIDLTGEALASGLRFAASSHQ